ncbi:MAG: DNA/RNA non-specific endonuclease [Clostridia bacterium]|nr:DNA/RNA non-specific endonuclease [Clostridia bacterium]
MLPIRFIAESFGFAVSWNGDTRQITITNTGWHFSLCDIPAFSGSPYVTYNSNIPMFSGGQISSASYEYYGELDSLGRCTGCIASVGRDIMPTEERGEIGMIKPSGWHTVKYDIVDGKYLYNRCHLIGFQLTGENANEKNLITGTRYLNKEGMLPFENKVGNYVRRTGNHVMYRAMPIFGGSNSLASGVLLEAFSVEDNGAGICFCVFCYNAHPGIYINYANGDSCQESANAAVTRQVTSAYILNTNSKKFHYPSCTSAALISERNRRESNKTRNELIAEGYSPCGICKP